METYSRIYDFNVTEAIKGGRTVLVTDLKERTVVNTALITLEDFLTALSDKSGRFQFFEVEKIEAAEKEVAHESV